MGLQNTLVFDDDSQFRDTFVEICEIHDVGWKRYGTQHHSALEIRERYHEPIRRTFRKLRIDHPKLNKDFLLSLAVEACNDTLGPEGVEPSALVFGEFPSLRSFLGPKVPSTILAEQAQAALTTRKVMEESQAKSKLKRAMKHQSPKMQNYTYSPGDKVLV